MDLLEEMKQSQGKYKKDPEQGRHSGAKKGRISHYEETDLGASLRKAVLDPAFVRERRPLFLPPEDLLQKRYREKKHAAILFVVDASRSVGAGQRLAFAKGAVMAMLSKAYADRDRTGLVLFGNGRADLVLPFTKSVDFAAEKMTDLSAKGNTPLAMGLRLACKVMEQDEKKHPEDLRILVLLTDGKSNYDVEEGKPLALVLEAADRIRKKELPLLVIDTENSVFGLKLAKKIADRAEGTYVNL